jgi:hypothetical protein
MNSVKPISGESIHPPTHQWFYRPLLDLGRFFSSFTFLPVGRTPWTIDQPITRLLPAHRTTQSQNKHTQTSMPQIGFEPMIPVFEWADSTCLRLHDHCDRYQYNYSYINTWDRLCPLYAMKYKIFLIKLVAWDVIFSSAVIPKVTLTRLLIKRAAVIQIKRKSLWALCISYV